MIPYIEWHAFQVFGVTFQVWGMFVAVAFIVATAIAARRAKTQGLNPRHVWDVAAWIFIAAFIGARLVHVMFYEPAFALAHPWSIIDPRLPGFAIYGGFIGAVVAFVWYMRRHKLDLLSYADALAWGLPWGCGIGRIGCFLIHDHPGTLTSFVLGVKYPDGSVHHDLGLYLSIVGFAIGLIFLIFRRRHLPPGFFVAAFFVLDATARLWLDFYRLADTRYASLTPTQWISIPLILGGGYWLLGILRKPPHASV